MLLLVASALAGFYHPADVAAQSEAFRAASNRSAKSAKDAQAKARAYATALRRFEEGLDLLGPAEPAGQRDRLASLEKQYNRDFAVLQSFADTMVGDFDQAFQDALGRALAAHPDATKCKAEVADGPKLPGMRQRTKPNPECTGESLNLALASAMDADATLKSDLEAVLTREWPGFATGAAEPVAPTGGEQWLDVSAFFRAAVPDKLRAIDRLDEEARLPFEVAIEQGADSATLEGLKAEAEAVDAKTRQRRVAMAAETLERAAVLFDKQSPAAGWCAQPELFGGCTGNKGAGLAGVLQADKKVAKALAR